ncbi:hypothetical protein M0805_005649 [Coniferiporia weirii]|nr:hypothetical protein M0805_005649 [Coniferiporia weirii]
MLRTILLAFAGLVLTFLLALSAFNTPSKISPQGCRMSYMSPSYALQTDFNASWTSASLANRYRLMLYREVGWDSNNEYKLRGVPVLFIPGNAGSAHQVRSIASSATRQYYSSPSQTEPYFTSRGLKPLDIFAVDFNEDLSAFHGPTLESEQQYSAAAISYILSLYPAGTQIIIMGHSMGGIVATALLPSPHISAIITMSTPHGAPPARFDARMDRIFEEVTARLTHDPTPILSVCGGITDTMIPSEFCTLPPITETGGGLRKTVFTSALDGCWTGVDHREMVWCHQVRWRVARALLELGGAQTETEKARILNTWLRDGMGLPAYDASSEEVSWSDSEDVGLESIPESRPLLVRSPQGTQYYKFAIPRSESGHPRNFVLYISGGAILSVSPSSPLPLNASVRYCQRLPTGTVCKPLLPTSLRLIPNPTPGKPFPAPSEGVDESDGVVAFTASISPSTVDEMQEEWIFVKTENGNRRGWLAATLENGREYVHNVAALAPLYTSIDVRLDPKILYSAIQLPELLSNVLLIYRVVPKLSQSCAGSLLPPILLHTSGLSEGHYHRLEDGQPILLHSHTSAPFLPIPSHLTTSFSRGLNLTVFSSGECGVEEINITVDWWNSFGRWGPRYWNAVLAWSTGVVAFIFYSSWKAWDSGAPMPTPLQAFRSNSRLLPRAMVLFYLFSFLPLSSGYWLGNVGEPLFAPIAPFILLLSSGLVALSWVLLMVLLAPYGWVVSIVSKAEIDTPEEGQVSHRGAILKILATCQLVFVLIPWQVAFLACYLIHFHHCAVLLYARLNTLEQHDLRSQKLHVLLMMTWCLPVVAPVLAVWMRTLMTAGFTTPFDGDHFVLNVLAFLVLTYAMSTARGPVFSRRHRFEYAPVPYAYACGAAVVFLVGPRATYRMYEVLNWPTFALLCFRAAPRYFSGAGAGR